MDGCSTRRVLIKFSENLLEEVLGTTDRPPHFVLNICKAYLFGCETINPNFEHERHVPQLFLLFITMSVDFQFHYLLKRWINFLFTGRHSSGCIWQVKSGEKGNSNAFDVSYVVNSIRGASWVVKCEQKFSNLPRNALASIIDGANFFNSRLRNAAGSTHEHRHKKNL